MNTDIVEFMLAGGLVLACIGILLTVAYAIGYERGRGDAWDRIEKMEGEYRRHDQGNDQG